MDWFFGFKLHLVVNEQGELLNVMLTPENTDDCKPVAKLLQRLFGKVFAERGYISQKQVVHLLEDFRHPTDSKTTPHDEESIDGAYR